MSNSLLDDIEEEYHTHLLERGNLLKKKKAVESPPPFVPTWEFVEHVSRVELCTCNHCGAENFRLLGVFARYRGYAGVTKDSALDLAVYLAQGTPKTTQLLEATTSPLCALCVPS